MPNHIFSLQSTKTKIKVPPMKNLKLSVSLFILAMGFGIGSALATTLTSVTPNLGDTYGGARIRLNGSGFTGATSVTIGSHRR